MIKIIKDITMALTGNYPCNFNIPTYITDFSKAFDSVDHFNLICILDKLGIREPLYPGSTRT